MRRGSLVALACAVGAGVWIHRARRQAWRADVSAVCTSEARAHISLVAGRKVVEDAARGVVRTEDGRALVAALRTERPLEAADKLGAAAKSAGVDPCPAVSGYGLLADRIALQRSADDLCRRLEPAILAHTPRASRFERLTEWAHGTVRDPALDELLSHARGLALEAATAKLRAELSDLDLHTCGMLAGLASPLDPVAGANVIVRSVVLQSDPREDAMGPLLRNTAPALRRCYDLGLAKSATLKGTLTIKFRMTGEGAIDLATVQEDSTVTTPEVVDCVTQAIKAVKGPRGPMTSPGGVALDLFVSR